MHKRMLPHGDADHMGEAKYLVNNFKVEKILINDNKINYLEQELFQITNNVEISKEGTYITCGDFELIQLNTNLVDENDSSQVYFGKFQNYTFLFMGDASTKTEEYILKNYELSNIDILKVGHHGSKTSSDKKFISKINPTFSLISVGKDNKFGHPNYNVLDNLKDSKIYRTNQDGSVIFNVKNNKLQIEIYKL